MRHKIGYFVTISFISIVRNIEPPPGVIQGTGLMAGAKNTCQDLTMELGTGCLLLQKKMTNQEGRNLCLEL